MSKRTVLLILFALGAMLAWVRLLPPSSGQEDICSSPGALEASPFAGSTAPSVPQTREPMNAPLSADPAPGDAATTRIEIPKFALPQSLTFPAHSMPNPDPSLVPLLEVVRDAAISVDQILKSKKYRINSYGDSIWLTSVDEERSMMWTITPFRTNAVVGAITATFYQGEDQKTKDPTRSFQIQLDPEAGSLLSFFWGDNHEALVVSPNTGSYSYARHLEGKKRMVMKWDASGSLLSSNVYDWAVRGRVIGE
jgi:hypothetical protein